jgi:general secretion pathway protein M
MSTRLKELAAFWQQRTSRERAFLSVMLVSLALFAYWFGLLAPLRNWAADAGLRHASAQAALQRLPGMLEEIQGRRPIARTAPDARFLTENAAAAGVIVAVDSAGQADPSTVRFRDVAPEALFAWLGKLRDAHGLSPSQASIRRTPSGVEGELTFAATPP